MVWTTVSPCGTVAVTVIAWCLLSISSEQCKTQEKNGSYRPCLLIYKQRLGLLYTLQYTKYSSIH